MKARLSFILFLIPATLLAQDGYEPFIAEGKVWNYEYSYSRGGSEIYTYYFKLYFSGDTIIDGKPCKLLIEKHPDIPPYIDGACYEECKRVYMTSVTSGTPVFRVLFDFSLEEGDTVTGLYSLRDDSLIAGEPCVVSTFGKSRKLLALSSVKYPGKPFGYWLEGVGSRFDMFDIWPGAAASVKFVYCEMDGEVIADQSSFGDAALSTSYIRHETTYKTDIPSAVYDLQGRRIHCIPSHGIYIQNGRKYVR